MSTPTLDLGAWIGRRQAFGAVCGRTAASEAMCLRTIRDQKLYLSVAESWEEFCDRHAGISRAHADRVIRYLDEFGIGYFQLAQIIRISPQTYRELAPRITGEGIQFNGEIIPFGIEHTPRLAAAIRYLRTRKPSPPPADPFTAIAAQLRDALRRLDSLPEISPEQKRELSALLSELRRYAV